MYFYATGAFSCLPVKCSGLAPKKNITVASKTYSYVDKCGRKTEIKVNLRANGDLLVYGKVKDSSGKTIVVIQEVFDVRGKCVHVDPKFPKPKPIIGARSA